MKIALTAVIFAMSMPVWAATKEADLSCRKYMEIASVVMDARQRGLPLSKALEFNDKAYSKEPDSLMESISRGIITDAYEQPIFESEKYKIQQKEQFANKYYLGCLYVVK